MNCVITRMITDSTEGAGPGQEQQRAGHPRQVIDGHVYTGHLEPNPGAMTRPEKAPPRPMLVRVKNRDGECCHHRLTDIIPGVRWCDNCGTIHAPEWHPKGVTPNLNICATCTHWGPDFTGPALQCAIKSSVGTKVSTSPAITCQDHNPRNPARHIPNISVYDIDLNQLP